MAQSSRTGLMSVLQNNVVEALFVRRHIKPGHPPTRRALITNCNALLNSPLGRKVLNYHPPRGFSKPYSIVEKNLILTWDIFWQDFRTFNGEGAQIIQAMPASTGEQQDEFWRYFEANIANMTPQQKMAFMDS